MMSGPHLQHYQVLTSSPLTYSQKNLKDSQILSSQYTNRRSFNKMDSSSVNHRCIIKIFKVEHEMSDLNDRIEEERRNLKIKSINQGSYYTNHHVKLSLPKIRNIPVKKPFPQVSRTPQLIYQSKIKQFPLLTPLIESNVSRQETFAKKHLTTSEQDQAYFIQNLDDKNTFTTPQRMVYASRTKAGCQYNKMTKTNQDVAIVNPKVIEQFGYNFFAVSDGHGLSGHLVSGCIKNNLPKNIAKYLKNGELNSEGLTQALIKSFLFTNRQIFQSDIDSNLSGSTTTSILIKNNKLFSANVGDSRVVTCRYINGLWMAVPLTIDHKPENDRERKRIIDRGGRIEAQKDYNGNAIGPERVWLAYIDAPGLAMTRSFGDKVGAQAGVIAEPEILEFTISNQDKFMIVASDGVWDYMTTDQIMNVVVPFYNRNNIDQAADRLIFEASNAWRRKPRKVMFEMIQLVSSFFQSECLTNYINNLMDAKPNRQKNQIKEEKVINIPKSLYQKNGSYFIVINAKPNSKHSQISGISDEAVDINISAPPKDGEANDELLKYLSQALQIKKSEISLQRGGKARDKLIQLGASSFKSLEDLHQAIIQVIQEEK